MAAIDTWEADIAAHDDHQAHEAEETTPNAIVVSDRPARARERSKIPAPANASLTPLGDRLRELVAADPGRIAGVYLEALEAVRTVRFKGGAYEEPDYATRLRAADAIANRAEGMPLARSELTGAGGGPITLAALLATDARDTE